MKINPSLFPTIVLGALVLAGLFGSTGARAEGRAALMVSVEAASTPTDTDKIVLTYGVPVSVAQIHLDISQISQQTGWMIDELQITTNQDPTHPELGILYSAEVSTSNAINRTSGRLPVKDLVMALKDYRNLLLVFDVPGPFSYSGNQKYSDRSIDITMEPQTVGSYTYAFEVQIKDPSFSSGSMPDVNAAPKGNSLSLIYILGALAGALLVGWAAYLIILKLTTREEISTDN
ncbi:MAG: hypothetical protein M3Y56_12740 [Armatimonadota bacterium]|nr:hypothetical protein [Armatimonadota bacterium]